MKWNCPKRKKDLRDEKPSVVGVAKGSHLGGGGDVFLATAESLGKSYWILDSGCSFQICLVREHFDTYQRCEKRYCQHAKWCTNRGCPGGNSTDSHV